MRNKRVRDIDSYKDSGSVIWANEIPRTDLCHCIAWYRGTPDADNETSDEDWIRILRPSLKRPPAPPVSVAPWVKDEELRDSQSGDFPSLLQRRFSESTDGPEIRLDDHPEVVQVWNSYLENEWLPWAEQDSVDRSVLKVYKDLYWIYERQQRVGESQEVIFGLGLLSWIDSDEQKVSRHLVTTQASIRFDAETGTLTVASAADGEAPLFEQDMLNPQDQADPKVLNSIQARLEENSDSLWSAGPIDGLLQSWVHSIHAEGQYYDRLAIPEQSNSTPIVHLAPALILRPRNEQSRVRAFSDILEYLETHDLVPVGVKHFVGASDTQPYETSVGAKTGVVSPTEMYFPLPANDQQRQIVERLSGNQGVIVQGPPGTGKSHTIVNLICHALATGQRVLVTSHTARALKVLREMIERKASDLSPLAVVLLGDDRESMDAMEKSIQGILSRQHTWRARESREAILTLETILDQERASKASVLKDLRAIRERETSKHNRFGYRGTLAQIAEKLHWQNETLCWIPDKVQEDSNTPLSTTEFAEYINLARNRRISTWEQAESIPIDLKGLPIVESFRESVELECRARENFEKTAETRKLPEYQQLLGVTEVDRNNLAEGLRNLIAQIENVRRHPITWINIATEQILSGFGSTWRQLHKETQNVSISLKSHASELDSYGIVVEPTDLPLPTLLADTEKMIKHYNTGHRWALWPSHIKAMKRLRQCKIGGLHCRKEDLKTLSERIEVIQKWYGLQKSWKRYHNLEVTTFVGLVPQLEDLCGQINKAFRAFEIKEYSQDILNRSSVLFEPNWFDTNVLQRWIDVLSAIEVELQYQINRDYFSRFLKFIDTQKNDRRRDPFLLQLQAAIENRNAKEYEAAWKLASENVDLSNQLKRKLELAKSLQDKVPELTSEIEKTPVDRVWDERIKTLEAAWNWSKAHAWVGRLTKPGAEKQHRAMLESTKDRIANILGQLAAQKAWHHCFDQMTESHRRYLIGWSQAVAAIGKGTGKHAGRYRREARYNLNKCREAIPAWVMPLHRVTETIEPRPEIFDLAIIDEASQSGPEAHILTWLARKLVVVGDDKQIRPNYPGLTYDDVYHMRERHIADLPHSDVYRVRCSFFDIASIWCKARVRLREHFRCMPEIIQFSNNLSYAAEPLIPLRQYGVGRLEPTIVHRFVREGYEEGKGQSLRNPPEARAIVAEIVRIAEQPRYANKSIGVISLVGVSQARFIRDLLIEEIGIEKYRHHHIVCGDSYEFQGDERDVIFLSMVSAPKEKRRIRAMTDQDSQRRFNVAVSRARDQIYLFHSAAISDLNPKCLRHQLLSYCIEPHGGTPGLDGLDLTQIERAAYESDRQNIKAPDPFDSWFEVDVFLQISRRKYRVIPQFLAGDYHIDLVICGMDGMLAVECDGDAWHGPERYEDDALRQLDLERAGWTFWRVRESVFRLDPDTALSGLWDTLTKHGILSTDRKEMVDHPKKCGELMAASDEGSAGTGYRTGSREQDTGTAVSVTPSQSSVTDQPIDSSVGCETRECDKTSLDRSSSSVLDVGSVTEAGSRGQTPSLSGTKPSAETECVGGLPQYLEWTSGQAVGDPRTASQKELIKLLAEVTEREGPVVAVRAYRLINRASGSQRLTALARRALERACDTAIESGNLVAANPLGLEEHGRLVLRSPESPEVVIRQRGPRDLDELPPDEIAAILRSLIDDTEQVNVEGLKKRAIEELRWARLTRKINDFLEQCIKLMYHADD